MSAPLDYFESDRPKATSPQLQKFVAVLYWLGLMVINALLAVIWYQKLDNVYFVLGTIALYIWGSLLFTYGIHIAFTIFFLDTWHWLFRVLQYQGIGHRIENWVRRRFTLLFLGLFSQGSILFYLLFQLWTSL